jgi:hypothetical protein
MDFMTMFVMIRSPTSLAVLAVMLHGMAFHVSVNVMLVVTVVFFMTLHGS